MNGGGHLPEPPENSVEALERRRDELIYMHAAVAKDNTMLNAEKGFELRRLTALIIDRDRRLERARRTQETAAVILDLAETPGSDAA